MMDYWTKLDERAEFLRLKDVDKFIKYCASHLKLWLDADVENLIADCEGEKAYALLCSKFPEIVIKRVEEGCQTPYDELYFNSIEFHCIRTKGACFFTGTNDIADYFFIKADFVEHPEKLERMQYQEAIRLHYVTHREELMEYIKSHNITI